MSGGFEIEGEWSDEGGTGVRYYDKRTSDLKLDDSGGMSPKKIDLDPPPLRPGEPVELAAAAAKVRDVLDRTSDMATYPPPIVDEARLKTLEATLTDVMRRLKALEERVIDPSV